jgi:UMF1 family MFS transporter
VADRFLLSAVLFAAFAVPIFLVVRERGEAGPGIGLADVAASWSQLATTVRHAREVPGLLRFLVGRFFYSDAVNTIIVVMSVVTVKAMGLSEANANLVLLGLTVVAVLASVGWGWLVDRLGPKRTLMIVLASWAIGLVLGAISLSLPGGAGLALFLFAGAILGSGLGGVQVADRVLMVRLSPPDRLGEFFGLYGLVGKGSQVIGQLLYGLIILLLLDALGTGAYQVAVLSLLVTMLIGVWLLRPVGDRWAGSGDVPVAAPPDRLAPASAPIEPR